MVDGLEIARHLVRHDFFKRPWYAFGMMVATIEAMHMDKKQVTVMEFGVAQGLGILELCSIAEHLNKLTGIQYNIFGFDSGEGLLNVDSAKDHPEVWNKNQFPMTNRENLVKSIEGRAEIIFGDVKDTVSHFLATRMSEASPIGFVIIDIDTYTACVEALKIFLGKWPDTYFPAVPMYVDDVQDLITYNEWCGEELAIKEFCQLSDARKIQKKTVRPSSARKAWHHHYYFFHCLDHTIRSGGGKRRPFEINVDDF